MTAAFGLHLSRYGGHQLGEGAEQVAVARGVVGKPVKV
jgi:hypothetical protein